MIIQFGILFRLSICHDFYDGQQDASVILRPTPSTQRLLTNSRMLSKMNKGKLEIGAEVTPTDDGQVLIDRIQDPIELNFTLHCNDTFWSNYTDQLNTNGNGYFFSNSNFTKEEERILMHGSERVSADNSIEIIGNTRLEFPIESEITLTTKGIEEEDRSTAIQTEQNKKVLNTAKLDEGLYLLKVDDIEKSIFISSHTGPCSGIVQIIIAPDKKDLAPVVDSNWVLQTPDFTAHFKNRESLWRYHFTQSNLEHLEGIEITNGGDESPFGKPEETIGPDGKTWILISSNEPLAITEKPNQYLQLKKNMKIENRSEGVVIDRLPVPNKENLYRVGQDGSILTDLFINL